MGYIAKLNECAEFLSHKFVKHNTLHHEHLSIWNELGNQKGFSKITSLPQCVYMHTKHVEHVFSCRIFLNNATFFPVAQLVCCISQHASSRGGFSFCIRKAFPETFQQEGVLHGVSSNLVILDDGTSPPVQHPREKAVR